MYFSANVYGYFLFRNSTSKVCLVEVFRIFETEIELFVFIFIGYFGDTVIKKQYKARRQRINPSILLQRIQDKLVNYPTEFVNLFDFLGTL